MEIAKLMENKEPSFIYGIIGNINLISNYQNYSLVSYYCFNKTVKEYINNSKISQALKMVLLDDTYLNKTVSELSINEIKKVNLARALCQNKDYLVLDYFDKELNYQEKEYFKRLFKKIATDYHKTIIINTNDLNFIWNIAHELIVINKEEIKSFSKNDFSILDIVNKPPIIEFIDLLKDKNINIAYYKETADLLKAIYRLKE